MKKLRNLSRYTFNSETNEVLNVATNKPVKVEGKGEKTFVRLTDDNGKRLSIKVSELPNYVGAAKREPKAPKEKKAKEPKAPKEPKVPEERVEILNGYTMAKSRVKAIKEEIDADKKVEKIKAIAADKETSKNDKVRELLNMNCPHPWIVVLVKVWPAYVHNVIKADEARAAKEKK